MAIARKKSPIKKPPRKRAGRPEQLESQTALAPVSVESNARTEALQAYIRSLKEYPLLTPQRENEIARKYFDSKDKHSAQLLILSNLRLVVKIAYEYLRTGFHALDLIQEGNIGLMRAVQDYDPYRGVKFSSYAAHWIKAYIRSFILSNWSLVKMGTTKAQRTLFYRLQKEKAKLEALGLRAEPKYLAERLHVKETEVIDMSQRLSGKDLSLNSPLRSDDPDGETMIQVLRGQQEGMDEHLANQEIQDEFETRLNAFERTLTGKELIVFRERMRAEEPKTLQDIGNQYQITRERVRQIESRVMERLRDYMKENANFKEMIIDVKPPKEP